MIHRIVKFATVGPNRIAQLPNPAKRRASRWPEITGSTTVSNKLTAVLSNCRASICCWACAAMPKAIGTAKGESNVAVVVKLTE